MAQTKPTIDDKDDADSRGSVDYWERWLEVAKKAADTHWEDSKAAWREYENKGEASPGKVVRDDGQRDTYYPIYWSSVKTLEPAYYSRTPKITTRRQFSIEDPTALTGGLIIERLGTFLVEQCEFDAVMSSAVADFIHADKTCTQLLYDHDLEDVQERVPLAQVDEFTFVTESGEAWEDEVSMDEQGYFGIEVVETPINQVIKVKPCLYDEVLHTPEAKCHDEIEEMAYYFRMGREEVEDRFGSEVADEVNWLKSRDSSKEQKEPEYREDNEESFGEYCEGWEIWCKETKKVYWLSEQYADEFLDVVDDPYQLKDFFPSPPFIIGSKPSKSMFPTPTYIHLRPAIKELHNASKRVSHLIKGIRRRCIVLGADDDVIACLEKAEELEFVALKSLANVMEKGGLDNMIWYIPVKELVEAIGELNGLQEKFKNEFFEFFGVPDILRGSTDPLETLGAQELKATAAHDRFKFAKKQVAQVCRDSIEMMVDLALGVFDDAKIADLVGYEFMRDDDKARFPEALQMVKDDNTRVIRVDIDTDTMSFIDEQFAAKQMGQAVQVISQGLEQVGRMAKEAPEYAAVGLQVLQMSLESMAVGRQFQDSVKTAVDKMIEREVNKPPPPQAPDYEAMKIQLANQKLMVESQFKTQAAQFDAAVEQRKLDQEEIKIAIDAQDQATKGQRENLLAQIKQMAAQVDVMTETRKLELEEVKIALTAQEVATEDAHKNADRIMERMELQLEETVQNFMMHIEAQKLELQRAKLQIEAQESMMEELRLAKEVDNQLLIAATQSAKENPPAVEQAPIVVNPPTVNVTVEPRKPGKRTGRIITDEFGNQSIEITEEIPDDVTDAVTSEMEAAAAVEAGPTLQRSINTLE